MNDQETQEIIEEIQFLHPQYASPSTYYNAIVGNGNARVKVGNFADEDFEQ